MLDVSVLIGMFACIVWLYIHVFFFLMIPPPPISTLFPYTTLFRSYPTKGYIKTSKGYRKILTQGKLGSQFIPWSKVYPDKPVFVGYNHEVSLKKILHLFNSLPPDFQDQIKLLSGNTRRKSQVIFLMKNGNVVIGNVSTLKSKIKYYNKIKTKVGKKDRKSVE